MTGEGIHDLWESVKGYRSVKSRMEQDRNWMIYHAEKILVERFQQFCEEKVGSSREIDDERHIG